MPEPLNEIDYQLERLFERERLAHEKQAHGRVAGPMQHEVARMIRTDWEALEALGVSPRGAAVDEDGAYIGLMV